MLFVNVGSAQQLPHYSLYMFNDAVINPAVCGTKSYDIISIYSRSQWAGFEGAPKTQLLTYNRTQGDRMGLGGIIFNDVTGPISRTGVQLSYAYNIEVSSSYKLSFGIAGSMLQYVFDADKAILHDNDFDPAVLGGVENNFIQDATFGTYLYNKNYYIGFSLPQLIQSKISLNTEENEPSRHYFITSGYNASLNDQIDLEPSIMLKSTDASPMQYDINLRAIYEKNIWAGLSYRDQDALVVMLGMDYNNYSFGYAFDRTISDINTYALGSHSFMLSYKLNDKKQVKKVVDKKIDKVDLDRDNDGINDDEDACPETAGVKENRGCPILTISQASIVDTAFTNLEFITGKSAIKFSSYKSLERLGKLLVDNPKMQLRIEGHTDAIGPDGLNIELSKARASAVKMFLIDRGIDNNRILTLSFGEKRPIASNETEEGRAKNRRVELNIFFK